MKMNFIQVELGLGLLIAKTDLPCLFKRLRGPAPMHPRGVSGYLKLGGQVVMWRATAAAHWDLLKILVLKFKYGNQLVL